MKNFLKTVSIIMVVIILVFAMGCNGNNNNNSEQNESNNEVNQQNNDSQNNNSENDSQNNVSNNNSNDDEVNNEEDVDQDSDIGGEITILVGEPSNVLGFPIAGGTMEMFMSMPGIEWLARYDGEGNIQGWLAKEIITQPEELKIILKLNEGITYHDGTSFNAQAVCDVWQIYKENGYESRFNSVESFEATGEYEVTVNLKEWRNNILSSICIEAGAMISPAKFNEVGMEAMYTDIVGTGPYVLENYSVSEEVVYVRNDNYWIEGAPKLDKINLVMVADNNTKVNMLKTGIGDVAFDVGEQFGSQLIEEGYENLTSPTLISPTLMGLYFASGNEEDPVSDLKVRQAICHAIDREALVGAFTYGTGIVTDQLGVPGTKEYSESTDGYHYNLEKAKLLLNEAGYSEGECTITLCYQVYAEEMYTAIQAMLTEAGFNVELDPVDASVYGDRIVVGRPAPYTSVVQWFAPTKVNDWFRYFSENPSTMVVNNLDYEEIGVISAYDKAMKAFTDEEQQAAIDELMEIAIDEYCLFCPMYAVLPIHITDGSVKDSEIGKYWIPQWAPEKVWIEK